MDDLDSSEIIAYLERLKGGLKGPGPDLHLSYDLADGLRHRLVPR